MGPTQCRRRGDVDRVAVCVWSKVYVRAEWPDGMRLLSAVSWCRTGASGSGGGSVEAVRCSTASSQLRSVWRLWGPVQKSLRVFRVAP